MNTATWVLGTLLPGLAVAVGALKWFVKQEMRPHQAKMDLIATRVRRMGVQQKHTDEKVNLIYDIVKDKL